MSSKIKTYEESKAVVLTEDCNGFRAYIPKGSKVKNVYYCGEAKMTYSFDTLIDAISKQYSNIQPGDVFVCRSPSKRSCKALMRFGDGWTIIYVRFDKESGRLFIDG